MIRNQIADYLDCRKTLKKNTSCYELCGLGFTQLDENPNAQSDTETYINQVSASKDVQSYQTEFPFNFNLESTYAPTMEAYDISTRQCVGKEAQRDYVRVELFRPVEGVPNVFVARHFIVSVGVSGINGDGGKPVKVSGTLSAVTDAEIGYFNTVTKEFTFEEPIAGIGSLDITSSEGTETGKTAVIVSTALSDGNSYKYKTGVTLTPPAYGQVCTSGYTNWDGTSEIEATTGNKIMIVEITSENKAVKYGETTVTAKA